MSASTLSKKSDLIGVSAEEGDVLLHEQHCGALVREAEVECVRLVGERRGERLKCAQLVVSIVSDSARTRGVGLLTR